MKAWISLTVAALACFATPGRADTVAPLPADGRLVYVQKADSGCVVGVWDSKVPEASHTVATAECPEHGSFTAQGRVLVLTGDDYVQVYDIQSGKLGEPMAMPTDIPKRSLDTENLLAGYTHDGVLALQAIWAHPSPNNTLDKHLYLRKGDAWVTAEALVCPNYDSPCPFKQAFEAKAPDMAFGSGPDEIWNDALRGDPYVVQRTPETITEQTAGYDGAPLRNSLVFHVYGRYSKLVFDTQVGDDTDGIYTFRLSLVTPDDRTWVIGDDQFNATIVGHYMLFDGFFGGGKRLYDLGDGKVVLGGLSLAGWLP